MTHIDGKYTLPEAIARMEGWYGPITNRCVRNCNPGNIEWADWTKSPPYKAELELVQPGVKARFAKFPDADTGFAALRALLLGPAYKDLTIEQAINRYAPPSENSTNSYVKQVCSWVECNPDDIVWRVMTNAPPEE